MRKQKARERRNTLIALGGLCLIIVIGLVLFSKPGLIVPMPNSAYGSSLGSTLNGGGGECFNKANSEWLLCSVELDPGSGPSGRMLLRKEGHGCWRAKWLRSDRGQLKGCTTMWDLILPNKPGTLWGFD